MVYIIYCPSSSPPLLVVGLGLDLDLVDEAVVVPGIVTTAQDLMTDPDLAQGLGKLVTRADLAVAAGPEAGLLPGTNRGIVLSLRNVAGAGADLWRERTMGKSTQL